MNNMVDFLFKCLAYNLLDMICKSKQKGENVKLIMCFFVALWSDCHVAMCEF